MGNISNLTRKDIFDLFKYGIKEENWLTEEIVYYPYYGRIDIVNFLKRLYKLEVWKSRDSRLNNAEQEIAMHTRNGDYPDDWIFDDERFNLFYGEDKFLLNFLCEVFHPEVRDENKDWMKFFERINNLLHEDGYDLFVSSKLSGRDVFSWRLYTKKPDIYIPFSKRNKGRSLHITLSNETRHQLFNVMNVYNETFYLTDETNWHYTKLTSEFVFEDIYKFYIPKHYVDKNLVEIKEFKDFQQGTAPFVIFDVIESFYNHITESEKFESEINVIFKLNNINVELKNGEIWFLTDETLSIDDIVKFDENGIEELVRTADCLYKEGKYSYAVEKLWDAFERVKTYYYPRLNKKESANKIITDLSKDNDNFKSLFEDEFKKLTSIGNSYRIRHHEKNTIDINSNLHYKYFYKRCYSLISIVIENLQ